MEGSESEVKKLKNIWSLHFLESLLALQNTVSTDGQDDLELVHEMLRSCLLLPNVGTQVRYSHLAAAVILIFYRGPTLQAKTDKDLKEKKKNILHI